MIKAICGIFCVAAVVLVLLGLLGLLACLVGRIIDAAMNEEDDRG